jgi:NAD(P)-dependent dehydrogenase (short-subunit alcohol dehydrogenase family)
MSNDSNLLADKVILVTGASSGIGAAAARLFAREGATVVLTARRPDALEAVTAEINGTGGAASWVAGDVSVPADVERVTATVLERHGRIDGAFNNAGVGQGPGAMADVDEKRFDFIMAVNVKGVWLSMRAEIRAMLAAGNGGVILNNSSAGGIRAAAGISVYGASKHAVVGLTRAASHEYARAGIRVNALVPGIADTPMTAPWKQNDPATFEPTVARIPQGRIAQPNEVAEAAAFLLSDRAQYITGAVLPVDGGLTA